MFRDREPIYCHSAILTKRHGWYFASGGACRLTPIDCGCDVCARKMAEADYFDEADAEKEKNEQRRF